MERRRPHTVSVVIGVVVASALGFVADKVFWEQAIPRRLDCIVQSADGCIAWADPVRVRRYNAAQAGS